MPIMNPRQDLVTRRSQGRREDASTVPGERTTKAASMPSIMQPSMQANKPLGQQAPVMRESVQSGPAPASLAATSAAAAVPGQPPVTTTSERTHAIIGQDSPLMRQAATRGRQYAHQRGLLNSSLAAGSAQGAVLDRSIELGKADVVNEMQTFYAGLDKAKFESDANYRNRALDQEKQLQERRLTLDETVGLGGLEIDRDRFDSDVDYRNRVLAQEKELTAERLSFDKARFASDTGYRDRVLAQEASLAKGRLDFDVTRFRSDENYRRDVLAQEKDLQTERLMFDEKRFESDTDYRDRVLGQENDLANKRLDFDRDRFRSDAAYRQIVLAQELDIQTRRLDLTQEENEFRRTFDRDRFESDDRYRGDVLAQEKAIAKKRADLDIEAMGIRRDEIAQNGYQGLRNTLSQLYDSYQSTVANIMAIPDMSVRDRNAALRKALDDYDAARRDAGTLSGPSVPVNLRDPGPKSPTPTPTPGRPPTGTPRNARMDCESVGGTWDEQAQTCKFDTTPTPTTTRTPTPTTTRTPTPTPRRRPPDDLPSEPPAGPPIPW